MRGLQRIAGAPPKDRLVAPIRQRLQQTGLADTGLATEQHHAAAAARRVAQALLQHTDFVLALDQLHAASRLQTPSPDGSGMCQL